MITLFIILITQLKKPIYISLHCASIQSKDVPHQVLQIPFDQLGHPAPVLVPGNTA